MDPRDPPLRTGASLMVDLTAWWSAAPAFAAAIAWCVLPGALVTYVWGLRGVVAWGLAPVVSIGSIALGAVVGGLLGVPWSLGVAVAPALALGVVAGVVRLVARALRSLRGRTAAGRVRASDPPVADEAPMPAAGTPAVRASAARVIDDNATTRTVALPATRRADLFSPGGGDGAAHPVHPPQPDTDNGRNGGAPNGNGAVTGSRPGRDGAGVAVAALVGLVVAAGLGLVTMVLGIEVPSAVSQTYDAVFHYDAIARILATGDASSLTLGTLTAPTAATAFYPAAWHGLVSLVVLTTGASIPVAATVSATVVAAVVWPLTCTALVRVVSGPSWAAVGFAPVAAVGFIAFPWSLLTFGVLWPNLIGVSLVPAGLAAVAALCGLTATGSLTALRAAAFLPVVVVTLGLAHPSTLFSLAVLAVPPAAWWFGRLLLRHVRRGARIWPPLALLLVLAAAGAVAQFLLTSPLFDDVRAFDWPAYESAAQAVGEVALSSTNGKDAAWAISAVVLVGMLAAWRVPERRWLVGAHLASAALFLMAASLETPLAAAVTAFWYNDSYRLAAVLPVTGVPLAVLGVTAIGTAVHGRIPRLGAQLVAAVAAVAVVVASSGMYVRDHADFVATSYPDPPPVRGGLLSDSERAFFDRIGPEITPGTVVAQNPWSGSPLLWPLTGRAVLFPHLDGQWTPDQLYLARNLRDAATDPRVCAAADRLDVRYLLVGVTDFWSGDPRAARYPGLTPPDQGFRLVDADDQGNALFELTACG